MVARDVIPRVIINAPWYWRMVTHIGCPGPPPVFIHGDLADDGIAVRHGARPRAAFHGSEHIPKYELPRVIADLICYE